MKSTLIASLFGFLIPTVGIMGYNVWQDPYRYYRHIDDSTYSTNARWQNPGMIRNYEYDSALIGTSRFEYFKPSMFAPAGWKTLKVTAPGSMAYEQLAALEMVLKYGQIKRVVIEMSYVSYTAIPRRDPATFPEFLYRSSLETPFQYLLSLDLLLKSFKPHERRHQPLDELYVNWPSDQHKYNERSMLAAAKAACHRSVKRYGKRLDSELYLAQFDRLVALHPEVTFIAVFSPMSVLTLGAPSTDKTVSDGLARRLKFRSDVAHIAGKHKNMLLYDYASQADIVLDLSRYMDLGHFDMAVSEQMAAEIIAGTAPVANLDDINGPLLALRAEIDIAKLPCRNKGQSIRNTELADR